MMNVRLYIVGAGEFGREVYGWAMQMIAAGAEFEVAGFLDKSSDALDGFNLPVHVEGTPADFAFQRNDRFVIAVANPVARRRIAGVLTSRGAEFLSIVHPTVVTGLGNCFGVGCIICPGAIVTTNVKMGDHVIVNGNSAVGHDASIGSFTTLNGFVDVTGHAKIGEGVMLGSHASVLPKAVVGDNAIVGAGSVVLRSVEANTTVFGVPAKVIARRSPPQ